MVEVSREKIDNYKGPVNYNNNFEVINENSSSTGLRIVSNSAQKNARSGLSLNDCMAKGPDLLALLEDVLLHFRTVQIAIILDLTKAYQGIHRERRRNISGGSCGDGPRRKSGRTSPSQEPRSETWQQDCCWK